MALQTMDPCNILSYNDSTTGSGLCRLRRFLTGSSAAPAGIGSNTGTHPDLDLVVTARESRIRASAGLRLSGPAMLSLPGLYHHHHHQ